MVDEDPPQGGSGSLEQGQVPQHPSDLSVMVADRRYIRQRITFIYNKTNKDLDELTLKQINSFINDLTEFKSRIHTLNINIFSLALMQGKDQAYLDEKTAEELEYEHKITECLGRLEPFIVGNNPVSDRSSGSEHKIKLPEVQLPSFANGVEESLERFLFEFESILGKHNLSGHERFVYLKNQLKGSPKILIEALDITEQEYFTAKNLLVKAFASTLVQKYNAIRKLSQMSLSDDPYSYVGQIRTIINTFKHLNIDVDTIIQYFVWNGFSEEFQNHFIQIVNSSTPSLEEINENIFQAIERYSRQNKMREDNPKNSRNSKQRKDYDENSRDPKSSPGNVHNYALKVKGVKNGFKFCVLCENDRTTSEHFMRDCAVYDTAKKRTDKLVSIKGCTKCSFKNHETSKCRFVFRTKCKNCGGNHFTFLCLNDSRFGSESRISERVIIKVSFVEVLNCNSADDAIALPTLSCKLVDGKSRCYRVFKDGGCQRNFILTSLANKYNLKVIMNNVKLNIEGFNTNKIITTKVVRVPIVLGQNVYDIDAICVPEIKTKLHVKGLHEVVDTFVKKGYRLADKMLYDPKTVDIIDDISVILGADSDHLLSLNYKTFGSVYPMSSYISSQLGVLMSGNVGRMLRNLNNLPSCESYSKKIESCSVVNSCCKSNPLPGFSYDDLQYFEEDCINVYNNQCSVVLAEDGNVVESELNKATDEAIRSQSQNYLCYDSVMSDMETDTNLKLVNYVLDNTVQLESGHLQMPLPWNHKIVHLLGHNFNLSKQILKSNFTKLKKCPDKLLMYDDVFQEQLSLGIIERIEDIDSFVELHPESSFLPHMGVFKMSRETSKCRPVFLSNLCEKNVGSPNAVSHNQAMLPGPSLNHKISTSLIMTRFDKYIVTYDVKKAFQNIALRESDQNRLAFLWYRNVSKGDFTIVGYRNLKLSFGLRSSPCILMLSLFKMLIIDTHNDDKEIVNLKRALFNIIYMDNGGYTTNSLEDLKWAYETIPKIFEPYKFYLQQFHTNSSDLQSQIDRDFSQDPEEDVKLLGMKWNKTNDFLSPVKIELDVNANTKRTVLSTLNSIYDIFNIYAPILNRARLFLQNLLNDSSLDWDTVLSESLLSQWRNIVKQANKTPQISIPRSVGQRDSNYSLIAFSDASQYIYGVVIYIKDLSTNKISFLCSKSRLVSKNLKKKTIPVLEFIAICLGVESLQEILNELTGEVTTLPLNITSMELFTDSMVSLHWIRGYTLDYSKMQKRSAFVLNRLKILNRLCENFPIKFNHIDGKSNPADFVSRETSYKQLIKTNFYTGPEFLTSDLTCDNNDISLIVPNPLAATCEEIPDVVDDKVSTLCHSAGVEESSNECLPYVISPDRYSSITKMIGVYAHVLKFVYTLKDRVRGIKVRDINVNFRAMAFTKIIVREQTDHYPDLNSYFNKTPKNLSDIPKMVNQLNLIRENSVIKVKSKFPRTEKGYPILLPKKSLITELLIRDCHQNMAHIGTYTILRELRPYYFIPHCYSTVRKVIQNCVKCRKLNAKKLSLNQNDYREFRLNPEEIPFSYIFIDYAGPWTVKMGKERVKVWLLVITCCWSRAINIKICTKMDVTEFLRAVQLHIFEHGLFSFCTSDLGSQICSGTNVISNFLDDMETATYLQNHGIQQVKFSNFPKGNSALGSLVESSVKQVKLLINKSIGKNVLSYSDFEFVILKVIHLINRRPVAFKDGLRSLPEGDVPCAITPEILMKGRELISVNVIPQLQPVDNLDPDWSMKDPTEFIRQKYDKLQVVRTKLMKLYHGEFLATLTEQAVNKVDRYKSVTHHRLDPGDIVLLEEKLLKQSSYPMGVVTKVEINSRGEVTAAYVKKGDTGEVVYRHVISLILLLKRRECDEYLDNQIEENLSVVDDTSQNTSKRKRRKAALDCERKNLSLVDSNLL